MRGPLPYLDVRTGKKGPFLQLQAEDLFWVGLHIPARVDVDEWHFCDILTMSHMLQQFFWDSFENRSSNSAVTASKTGMYNCWCRNNLFLCWDSIKVAGVSCWSSLVLDLSVLSLNPVGCWINTRWGWLSLSSFRGWWNEYQCTGIGAQHQQHSRTPTKW